MEMKYVVPDMAQSFGTLEFAGESEPVFERDKNNRRVLARRSYNPVSYTHLDVYKRQGFFNMNVRNEIKAQIIRAGMTMQEVVDLLSDEYLSLIHI